VTKPIQRAVRIAHGPGMSAVASISAYRTIIKSSERSVWLVASSILLNKLSSACINRMYKRSMRISRITHLLRLSVNRCKCTVNACVLPRSAVSCCLSCDVCIRRQRLTTKLSMVLRRVRGSNYHVEWKRKTRVRQTKLQDVQFPAVKLQHMTSQNITAAIAGICISFTGHCVYTVTLCSKKVTPKFKSL